MAGQVRDRLRRGPTAVTAFGWLVAALPLAAWAVVQNGPFAVDREVRRLAVGRASASSDAVAEVVSQLGSAAVLLPVLVLLAVTLRTYYAALMPAVFTVGQVLEVVLLSALPRAPSELASWSGLSSGRTASAALGWGLVALVLGACARRALLAGVAAGAVVGVSRLVLDVHLFSDVVLALLFASAALAAVVAFGDRVPSRRWSGAQVAGWLRGSSWAWLLTVLGALIAVLPPLLEPSSRRLGDLAVYVGSADLVGRGGDLYGYRTDAGLPFTYPPFAALVAEPLARIPLGVVQVGWTLATLAAAVAVAAVALRPVVLLLGLPVTSALLLVSTPVRSHVRFGQVGLFLVLLVAADLLRRRRHSGWGVGLATAIKLTPGVYLAWLLLVRDWTRLRATAAWATGATLLGIVLLWPSSPTWLTSALWDSSRFGSNDIPGNQSVRGMLLRATTDDSTAERLWLALALVLLVVGLAGARRLELAGDRLGAVGVLAALSVAVSPISWQHHLVWLFLPIAALVAAGRTRLAAGWALLLIAPVTTVATRLDVPVLGALAVNTCGLTAVAGAVLLPRLLDAGRPAGTGGSQHPRHPARPLETSAGGPSEPV